MADRKISELTNITGANLADGDELVVVDASASETKAITFGEFKNALDTATGFVSITGDTMTGDLALSGADITFGDNDKAIFGAGSDLQIYHDGNSSIISDQGTGNLRLLAQNFVVADPTNTEAMIVGFPNGSVDLYYDNSKKLATTSTGIDVTGTVTADGLTVETGVTTQATAIELNGTSFADTERLSLDFSRGGSQGVRLSLEPDEAQTNGDFVIETGSFGSTSDRIRIEANGDISFYEDTGTTAKFFWDASDERLYIGDGTHNNDGFFLGGFSGGYQIFNTKASDIRIATNNTEAMRIDSSGNVGIGNTSSGYAFTSGETRLAVGDGSEHAAIQIYSGTAKWGGLEFADDATNGTGQGFIGYYHPSDYMQFNTAGSERMRIDSSGNLLVGTTSFNNDLAGIGLGASNFFYATRSGNLVGSFNRLSTDGSIIDFRKDGTTVGSIASRAGVVTSVILNPSTMGITEADTGGGPSLSPTNGSGATNDAAVDLGTSSIRWQDLYLSGGVYLGGTGAANKLDDYEEGTWTPSFRSGFSGAPTFNTRGARYTKIGRMVYCDFYIQVTGTGSSGQLQIDGLPFSSTSNSLSRGGGLSTYVDLITGNTMQFYGGPSISYFSCYINGNAAPSFSGSVTSKYLIGIYTYETDA